MKQLTLTITARTVDDIVEALFDVKTALDQGFWSECSAKPYLGLRVKYDITEVPEKLYEREEKQ